MTYADQVRGVLTTLPQKVEDIAGQTGLATYRVEKVLRSLRTNEGVEFVNDEAWVPSHLWRAFYFRHVGNKKVR